MQGRRSLTKELNSTRRQQEAPGSFDKSVGSRRYKMKCMKSSWAAVLRTDVEKAEG